MRKISFAANNFYHIYNRGVDKRLIFLDSEDLLRFLKIMKIFNVTEPIGSVYEYSFKELGSSAPKLVNFVAYCLNQNHFHFILEPLIENGIQKFMHRLSTGYTNYFNEKYKRSGSLFQGSYKAIHINTNDYLLHVSAYVNLNDKVHRERNKEWMKKFPFSSFLEYKSKEIKNQICEKVIILEQFRSSQEYEKFALSSLKDILRRRENEKEFKTLLLE
ncbi:transposase [Candidatus Nomurabacteria bacterium]|nr:transposase [Candidatus Nomurabacteria bacterium]